VFDVDTDQKTLLTGGAQEKSAKDIQSEISAIIRQITSSVTFLPLLEVPCTFDLLVYTPNNLEVPVAWEESDPKYIIKIKSSPFAFVYNQGPQGRNYRGI